MVFVVEGPVVLVRLLIEHLVELSAGIHIWLFIWWRESFNRDPQSLHRVK